MCEKELTIPKIILILLTWVASLFASQDLTYGLGGSSTGRVSGVVAEAENPFAALYNPALVAAQSRALFAFSANASGASYQPLRQVLVDGPRYRTQNGELVTQDVIPSPPGRLLWAGGVSYPFTLPPLLGAQRAGLGLTLSGPFEELRSFSAGSPYDFYPLRYGNSENQFKATVGASAELIPQTLFVGSGLSFYLSAAGNADAIISVDNPTGRLALNVSLNSALVLGLFAKLSAFQAGLVWRQAVDPVFEQRFQGGAQVAEGTSTIALLLLARASLYYEPQRIEAELQRRFGAVTTSLGLSFQQWADFRAPYLLISAPSAQQNIAQTKLPDLKLISTWNPRVSAQWQATEALVVAAGYQYRPSPVPEMTASSPLNLLDSDIHVWGASIGYRFPPSPAWPLPLTLTASAQYHWLTSRGVRKADSEFIGSPFYQVGGGAYTYGLNVQAEL